MTTTRRAAVCDAYRATGYLHRLGTEPYVLLHGGRRWAFCSAFPCLVGWLTNRPYEDLRPSAIGLAEDYAATGTG